ncbi:MAG TPA: IPT/TIG domain-containing protein [Vicinamibacterales bacterium]|nr:IPT/TIG domain-containing protein [Vicinamibacterales bacterium]
MLARISALALAFVGLLPYAAEAQATVTYRLHNEASTINAAKQLKAAPPDVAAVVRRSPDLKGSSSNWFLVLDYFETQAGVPNLSGTIPANSVVTFSVWLRKTTVEGIFHPTAVLHFNQYWGPVLGLCGAGQGPDTTLPKLTTTFTRYTFSCTIPTDRAMASSDRFYAEIGAWVDSAPARKSVQVELGIEGVLNGNYDSTIVVPLPVAPAISAIAPASGPAGQAVTIDGQNFGASQGSSSATFNGTPATVTSWSNTRIVAEVPSGATSGPVVVTVNGTSSNGVTFTVIQPPTISALNPTSGIAGQQVTITGANFGSAQGSSTVRFNGVDATPTSWSGGSIVTTVPAGATTGPVVVTVNGLTSNGSPFTVIPPPTLAALQPSSGYPGDPVTISGSGFAPEGSSVTFNGIAAAVTSATATTIVTSVPAQATSGPVVVIANGQSSNALPFTVLTPPTTGTLTIRTYVYDESAPGHQGSPAGADVYVAIDGVPAGRTAADGTLSVDVAPGEKVVTATVPSTSQGNAIATVVAGQTAIATVILTDSGDVAESTPLVVGEVVDGIVPVTSPTFTMSFMRGGTLLPVAKLEQVELINRAGNIEFELSSMFVLSSGRMVAQDPAWFFVWLPNVEPAVLRVRALDADGFTHESSVEFSLGQLALNVTVAPPPSNPALAVSNIDVTVSVAGTAIQMQRTTDSQGRITLPLMPYATVSLDAEKQAAGDFYYGEGVMALTEDSSVTLVMRSVTDIRNGVPPLEVPPSALVSLATPAEASARSAASSGASAFRQPAVALTAAAEGPTASVLVTSDGQGEPVEQSAPLTVPQGTKKVTLKYTVTSAEYPEWVRQKSPYDDVWVIDVFAGRQRLFNIRRQVNAQLTGDPAWQANGSTGEIQEELNVEALTTTQDVELTLRASATNIKDHLFPTSVSAVLGAEPKLAIRKADKDVAKPQPASIVDPDVKQTKGDSTYYSIPTGTTNVYERWFTLTVQKPENTTVERVTLKLKDAAGTTLQTLLNDEAPGANVQFEDEGRKIKVRASMHTVSSTVPTIPPATHYLRYEFVVKGTADGDPVESDPKESPEMHALWRMPQIFGRYSKRETGLDDWASRGAFDWLTKHSGLMRRINDISGEHALDLGHQGHARGVDIDMFHFYVFDANKSGQQNYELLRDNVFAALNGSAAAKTAVTSWVSESRTGLGALMDLADVTNVIYAVGNSRTEGAITLPEGWAATLIKTGTLTASQLTLDTGTGAWNKANSSKFLYNTIHNSHVHVSLDDSKLLK